MVCVQTRHFFLSHNPQQGLCAQVPTGLSCRPPQSNTGEHWGLGTPTGGAAVPPDPSICTGAENRAQDLPRMVSSPLTGPHGLGEKMIPPALQTALPSSPPELSSYWGAGGWTRTKPEGQQSPLRSRSHEGGKDSGSDSSWVQGADHLGWRETGSDTPVTDIIHTLPPPHCPTHLLSLATAPLPSPASPLTLTAFFCPTNICQHNLSPLNPLLPLLACAP